MGPQGRVKSLDGVKLNGVSANGVTEAIEAAEALEAAEVEEAEALEAAPKSLEEAGPLEAREVKSSESIEAAEEAGDIIFSLLEGFSFDDLEEDSDPSWPTSLLVSSTLIGQMSKELTFDTALTI